MIKAGAGMGMVHHKGTMGTKISQRSERTTEGTGIPGEGDGRADFADFHRSKRENR
jgi:hypothetical protein